MLNELDKELTKRGHPFVRYADDCMIFCRSARAAERILESLSKFIEGRLFLKVNRDKTGTGSVCGKKFLGYTFYFDGEREMPVPTASQDHYEAESQTKRADRPE